jgi:putative FmdB family regulatory protein
MPTYVYECLRCGERFELLQGINDAPRQRCPACRGKVRRVVMPGGGFIFKGSGFYITDYKRKERKAESAKSESGAGSTGAGESGGKSTPTGPDSGENGGQKRGDGK